MKLGRILRFRLRMPWHEKKLVDPGRIDYGPRAMLAKMPEHRLPPVL